MALLKQSNISKEEIRQHPQEVLDVLKFQTEGPNKPSPDIVQPASVKPDEPLTPDKVVFIEKNPEHFYKFVEKIGEGASGQVYIYLIIL